MVEGPLAASAPFLLTLLIIVLVAVCDARTLTPREQTHALLHGFRHPGRMLAVAMRPFGRMWAAYCVQLVRKPLLTRCLTGALGSLLSDAIAQKTVQAAARRRGAFPEPYHYGRTVRFVAYSFFVATPIAYKWYDMLDKCIMPRHPASAAAVVTKIVMDQVGMAPILTALFIVVMRTMEGRPKAAWQMLRERFWPLLRANWMVWPAAHVINFALVPPSQRILYLNAVGVVWGAIMAHVALSPSGPALSKSSSNGSNGGSDAHCQLVLSNDEVGDSIKRVGGNEVEMGIPRRVLSGLGARGRRTSGPLSLKEESFHMPQPHPHTMSHE